MAALTGIEDVLPQQLLRNLALLLWLIGAGLWRCCYAFCSNRSRVCPAVRVDNEAGQPLVLGRIYGVTDDAEDVEPGEDRFGELDVHGKRGGAVVAAADGVGGGDDGAAGLECRDDAGFGDGDGLLFHRFVDGGAVGVVHFVEFVDEARALVCEHEGAAFERPFGGERVAADGGGETNGRGALTGGEDGAVGGFLDIFQDLGFGGARVAEEEDVDIAADFVLALGFFGDAAEEGEGDGGFDVGVAVDGGGDTGDDFVDDLGVAGEGADGAFVGFGEAEAGELVVGLDDVVGFEDGGEDGEAVLVVQGRGVGVAVDAGDFDLFAWFGAVDEVPEEDDFAVAGESAGGGRCRGILGE